MRPHSFVKLGRVALDPAEDSDRVCGKSALAHQLPEDTGGELAAAIPSDTQKYYASDAWCRHLKGEDVCFMYGPE